eukprot:2738496-Amphidinium_carterae.1
MSEEDRRRVSRLARKFKDAIEESAANKKTVSKTKDAFEPAVSPKTWCPCAKHLAAFFAGSLYCIADLEHSNSYLVEIANHSTQNSKSGPNYYLFFC